MTHNRSSEAPTRIQFEDYPGSDETLSDLV
jgi:hypothetical protein